MPNDVEVPLTRWQKFRLVVKVVELRLRFIALMAATGLVFAYWDTLWNRYEKWTRPAGEHVAAASDIEFFCPMHPRSCRRSRAAARSAACRSRSGRRARRRRCPRGSSARVQLAPFRVAQAGIRTAEVGYAPLAETLTTVGSVELRRAAAGPDRLEGQGDVAGREALRQLHRRRRQGGRGPGRALQPRAVPGVQELLLAASGAARGVRRHDRAGPFAARRPAKTRPPRRREAQALGDHPGADRRDPQRRARPTSRCRSSRRSAASWSGRTSSRASTSPRASRCSRSPTCARLGPGPGLRGPGRPGPRRASRSRRPSRRIPGEVFPGKVAFIEPHLDPATRTVEVRYDLENPDHGSGPGMFATVTLKTPVAETPAFRTRLAAARRSADHAGHPSTMTVERAEGLPGHQGEARLDGRPDPGRGRRAARSGSAARPARRSSRPSPPSTWPARAPRRPDEVLTVPESAVIDTGDRKVVYVEAEPGVFEGREVVLGPRRRPLPGARGLSARREGRRRRRLPDRRREPAQPGRPRRPPSPRARRRTGHDPLRRVRPTASTGIEPGGARP